MGILDIFRGRETAVYRDPASALAITYEAVTSRVMGMSVEQLWREQASLRSVVSFMARNTAQLGVHTFERVSDTDRRRVRDNAVALLLARPNPWTTTYELVYDLVSSLSLYDEAHWLVAPSAESASGYELRSLPSRWVVGHQGGDYWHSEFLIVQAPGQAVVRVPSDMVLSFRGWNPASRSSGVSPVEALKATLSEQMYAQEYRQQVWQRGGRASMIIERPVGEWGDVARTRFKDSFSKAFEGRGSKAGGTLVLEDGMKAQRLGFSAHDEEYVEASKLSIATVASVYHVNPTMIGQLDNANYSNVKEFRQMLYSETLGPLLSQIEDRVNTFLLPMLDNPTGVYVEFNISEKLQGSFEEQAAVLSSSVGRPWMTADEARARNNMPALGGDAERLVTPLNVLIGGQASPRDSAPEETASGPSVAAKSARGKTKPTAGQTAKAGEVLSSFFTRQSDAVMSALGAKAGQSWWNEKRWNDELSADLYALSASVTTAVAARQLTALGIDPTEYDADQTLAYLAVVAKSNATSINAVTKQQLDAAIAEEDDPLTQAARVFDIAKNSRADQAGSTIATALAGFATVEAVKQVRGTRNATKTWITTSRNPRSSHAGMNGETVPIDEAFSNGANWPGDSSALDVDEVAGCQCDVQITIE